MIWILLLSLAFAAPPITQYLDYIGISILDVAGINGNICIISNKTIPYYANLFYDGRYDDIFYVSDGEWCREFNGTYLLKTDPQSTLTLYGAVVGPPKTFCVEFSNHTVICSNYSISLPEYNISILQVNDYNGTTLKVQSNHTIYLYWKDFLGYNYLGNCSYAPFALNTSLNYIPYGISDNLLFYIISRFSNASITYIRQIDPNNNYLGYCKGIIALDTYVNFSSPVLNGLVVSDYNRYFYPYENGVSVLALNNSFITHPESYQKPEFALPSEALFDSKTITSPEIPIGFTAVALLYLNTYPGVQLNELKPLLLASSNRSCNTFGCGSFNATMAAAYKARSLYLLPNTKTTIHLSAPVQDVVVYSLSNVSVDAYNVSQYKNIFFAQDTISGNFTITITATNYTKVIFVYKGDLIAITSNRSLYKGYYETLALNIKNNNPTNPFYIEGISVELWNDSGYVVDLLSEIIDKQIPANATILLPINFYIPNNVPDGYVKVKLYTRYTFEGVPLWQRGTEPVPLPGFNISPYNLTSFTAYKLEIPYYGILDLKNGFIDFDYITKSSCSLVDSTGNVVRFPSIINASRYILLCNKSLTKPINLFITYEYNAKNVTAPPRPPIEIFLNTTNLLTNNYNLLILSIRNNQLTTDTFNAINLILFNATDNFTWGLGRSFEVPPGENIYYFPLFIPDIPYTNFYVMLIKSHITEQAGKGSVYVNNYDNNLPVQKLAFGLKQYLNFWVDNITRSEYISFRKPSSICGFFPDPSAIQYSINGKVEEYMGESYSCGRYLLYYGASYAPFKSINIHPGYNTLWYYIKPNMERLRLSSSTNIAFSQGILIKKIYKYPSNLGNVSFSHIPIYPNSEVPLNITTDVKFAEGFLNKLYIKIKNNMTFPIILSYVDVKLGGHWVGAKRYNTPILPNQTFSDILHIYGTIENASSLSVNYIFSYELEPVVYKYPIPTYSSLCDSIYGPISCLKENTTYIEQARRYNFDMRGWDMGLVAPGEKRWIYRVPIYVSNYLRAISIYLKDINNVYYASPNSDPILLEKNPLSGYYLNIPAKTLYVGPGILSMESSGPAPKIKLKYYFALNETLSIPNPGVLDFLPLTLYYYKFRDQIYLKISNRNPVPLTIYYVQYYGNQDYKQPWYVGSIYADAFSNSTSYVRLSPFKSHGFATMDVYSPIKYLVITHVGRSWGYYATNVSTLNISLDRGYNAYVFQGGISKDINGTLMLDNESIHIFAGALTWINNSRLLFMPRLETPYYLIGDFILYTNASFGYFNITTGSLFISSQNCTAVLGELCGKPYLNLTKEGVEAYYLGYNPNGWRRGIGTISLVSRPDFDVSSWPMEDIVAGRYLYALRMYMPTNIYRLYLPAASTLYINGNEVNSSQLATYLIYGDDNNIVYTSNASNPYAYPIVIYGLPTIYASFNIRNISVYPAGYRYVGTPRSFNFTFNVTNNGNTLEHIYVFSNLSVYPINFTLNELQSQVFYVSLPELAEGDYLFYVNLTTQDNNISFLLPIVLNLTNQYIDFNVSLSNYTYNLTIPENATNLLYITSNASIPITISLSADSAGVDLPEQITLNPGETRTIVMKLNSLYIAQSKNITLTFTSHNITKQLTFEVTINTLSVASNVSFDVYVNPTLFNLTRPYNKTGNLYIVSNASDSIIYSIYTDHPAVLIPSYAVIDPNTTANISFTVSSLYTNGNTTAHIFVRARNLTKNVSLNLTINLPNGSVVGNFSRPDTRLRLVLDKTLLCVHENTTAYVYDGYGRYVDGAQIITSLKDYVAYEGRAVISFDRVGTFYVRAIMDGYNKSRTIYVVVENCNVETINEGNLSVKAVELPQSLQLPYVQLSYYDTITPSSKPLFQIDAPKKVLVNTTYFIRVYNNNKPYVGLIRVISPSGKEYFYTTDNRGYVLIIYDEPGVYRYEVTYQGKTYPGPKTLATTYLETTALSTTNVSLPFWPVWVVFLMLAWFIVKVEIITKKKGKLIGRVVNVLNMPVKNAEVIIKLPDKTITTNTDSNGIFVAKVDVQKARIYVKWRITIGSEHEKMDS